MSKYKHITTQKKIDAYDSSSVVFSGLIGEMRELSKKKAEATLNKGKVKIINRVLDDLRSVLKDESEAKYLDVLDDEELPQNSDAVLVMVQYESALSAFKARYHRHVRELGYATWITREIADRYGS